MSDFKNKIEEYEYVSSSTFGFGLTRVRIISNKI